MFETMTDLTDTTFIFPVIIESPDRFRNAHLTLSYMSARLKTNIIVNEVAKDFTPKLLTLCKELGIRYLFHAIQPADKFWRTRRINECLRLVNTPITVNADIDVILEEKSYEDAANKLRKNVLHFCVPFSYGQYQIRVKATMDDFESWKKDGFQGSADERFPNRIENTLSSCGHMQFILTKIYRNEYGENEYGFPGWGPEDIERQLRFRKLGYRVDWLGNETKVFHFEHSRGPDSCPNNPDYKNGKLLQQKLDKMRRGELVAYYNELRKQGGCY